MSLQTVTNKIDGILQGIALLVAVGMWAALGFPFIPEFAGLACLFVVSVSIYWWTTRRR
jgi:hypothetical protein